MGLLFVQHIPQTLNWIGIWEIWRLSQHLKPFQNHFCFVTGHVIQLKEATAIGEYCFHARMDMVLQQCLGTKFRH